MNNAKIWMLVTGIVLIASGFLVYSMIRARDAEKATFMVKAQEYQQTIAELEKDREALAALKKESAEAEAKYQAEIALLENQIADSKKSEASIKSRVDALLREKETLSKYIENTNAVVAKLNKKIEALEKARDSATESVKKIDVETEFKAVDHMLEEPSDTLSSRAPEMGAKLAEEEIVDLGRIVVHPSTNDAARVEHVNPLYGFIVLSAGTNEGLRKDTVVNITRNNRLIAKAVIKKARDNASSAVTLPEWTREDIKVGDLISINSPTPIPQR